ncbi:Receptor-type tyrosine-protein phosphatase mu [Anabarilius grahami]|uniref:Receptor-type tyrosine-protein phosphatase mu n=1 Tax=Anabarilius grahami TaxID=495550 RepID=A0A3N0YGY2_ANAGA|nr:Receptor-type tyrosine-protein phosphatase mu [Anabarilius grahami]
MSEKKVLRIPAVCVRVCLSVRDDCLLEKSYTECGYSQSKDDDFDWEQVNTKQKPSSDPWVPAVMEFNGIGGFSLCSAVSL